MSDPRTVEQQRLRDERARLDGQRVELQADTVRLQISRDIALLRALCDRLASHRAEMAALSAALHDYHAKYGPLGNADVVNNAVHVMKIATGEIEERTEDRKQV